MAFIPPVGINFIIVYGALIAFIILSPPAFSAGKNFTTSRPKPSAISSSVGVIMPGQTGKSFLMQYSTTFGLKPGETINFAPAPIARSTCSTVKTVPAPTSISGNFFAIARMLSSAASVRKVTSAQASPPATRAAPNGSASLTLFKTTTGTIPIAPIFFNVSFITSSTNILVF